MSIERSGTGVNAQFLSGPDASKGKVKPREEAQLPEAGGFKSVLTSLEPQPLVPPVKPKPDTKGQTHDVKPDVKSDVKAETAVEVKTAVEAKIEIQNDKEVAIDTATMAAAAMDTTRLLATATTTAMDTTTMPTTATATDDSPVTLKKSKVKEGSAQAPEPWVDPFMPLIPLLPTSIAKLLAQADNVAAAKLDTAPSGASVSANPVLDGNATRNDTSEGSQVEAENSSATPVAGRVPAAVDTLLTGKPAPNAKATLDAAKWGSTSSSSTVQTASSGSADAVLDSHPDVKAVLDQIAQSLPAQNQTQTHSNQARGLALQADLATQQADARASKLDALADVAARVYVAARESVLSNVGMNGAMGAGLLRPTDRIVTRSSALSAGYGVEGVWGQSSLQAGGRAEVPVVSVETSMTASEATVADKVSYWVAQGVQNAQIKLDGFGREPVEVNISLKGDQAHISFRTDQPEIRQLLEGAATQLKEMLISEGLVLSGVSVGASGQNGADAQNQRNQQNARQANIVTTEAVPAENRPRVPQSGTRALDLFV